MAMLLVTLAAQAATSYGIIIGGVEVTSDNCNNVTGGDIYGQVTYDPSTKTLTLTDVFIYRASGSENYALHNKSCDGLKVKLIGQNYLVSNNANAIRINKNVSMTIMVEGGLYNSIQSNSTDAIFAQADSRYHINFSGSGYVRINAPSGYGMKSDNSVIFDFGDGYYGSNTLEVEIIGAKGAVNWDHQMTFGYDCIVSMKATGNSSYPIITCGIIGWGDAPASGLLSARIDRPLGAEVNSARTTIIKNGIPVYNEDIVIVSKNLNYRVGINSTNFPDGDFRNYLLSLYPKRYLTQTDINNLTSLDCSGQYIKSLQGIGFFTALQELRCNNNRLSSLDLSNNTALTYLDCSHNNLTALRLYDHTRLKTLYCNDNQLTSLTLPSTSNNALQTINCSGNEFTTLNVSNYLNLTSFDASNNSSLINLSCYSNKLSTINVTNCPALTELRCYGNYNTYTTLDLTGTAALTYLDCGPSPYLTSITNLSSCTGMKTLYCYDNKMANLSAVSSMPALEYLSCHDTKITSLDVSNKSSLRTLKCYNNPNLTQLLCQNCALTTLDCKNCPAMTALKCWNNQFTSFDVTGNTALTYLDCAPNRTLTSITGLSSCTAMKKLYCYSIGLTDLSAVSSLTNLEELKCHDTKLTSLTVQNKSKLTNLYCYNIPTLTTATITGNTALPNLNIANCPALTTLNAYNNNLYILNVENDTEITTLKCYGNQNLSSISHLESCTKLTVLDFSSCNFSSFDISPYNLMMQLNCAGNKLTSLNVSGKTSLKHLICFENQLTSLNIQGCSSMTFLTAGSNKLTSLNAQGCNSLRDVRVQANQFTEAGMNTLINSLPTLSSSSTGQLCVLDYVEHSDDEQNVITASQIITARNKYWYPKQWAGSQWVDLELPLPGDVSGDGIVNISDVTVLNNAVMNEDFSGITTSNADMNNDGIINITDVTLLISYLMANP